MPKDKDQEPNGGDRGGYEVGYGRPPQHSRFQPGQSGNPAGRPKGLNNLRTDVKRTLEIPVRVQEGGRFRRISTQRGLLMRLREKALLGDPQAIKLCIELARFFNDEPSETVAQALPADDLAILADYEAEITAAAVQSPPAEPLKRVRLSGRHKSSSADDKSSK
jgi:hypothetical protein